jgi:hypothetical protein
MNMPAGYVHRIITFGSAHGLLAAAAVSRAHRVVNQPTFLQIAETLGKPFLREFNRASSTTRTRFFMHVFRDPWLREVELFPLLEQLVGAGHVLHRLVGFPAPTAPFLEGVRETSRMAEKAIQPTFRDAYSDEMYLADLDLLHRADELREGYVSSHVQFHALRASLSRCQITQRRFVNRLVGEAR